MHELHQASASDFSTTNYDCLSRCQEERRKTRYITEITEDNLSYCKELMHLVHDLRHLDPIRNNFMMSENEYLSSVGS